MNKLPVLIVAYCRASRLDNLLRILENEDRKVYVVIDKAPENLRTQNEAVIRCAESFLNKLDLEIHVNEIQAGVKFGVPKALDRIFLKEISCIIIEDDCLFNSTSLSYFDEMSQFVHSDIGMVAGDSPWNSIEMSQSTLSSFPLIWGWTTTRDQWVKLSQLIGGYIPCGKIVRTIIRRPRLATPILYFLSAQIRVKRDILQAWDCSLALNMLLNDMKCIIPNVRQIENLGADEFAHHTFGHESVLRQHEHKFKNASLILNVNKYEEILTNDSIKKRIYKMKWFHILSPLKAWLSRY
jgi:hypothetical protein